MQEGCYRVQNTRCTAPVTSERNYHLVMKRSPAVVKLFGDKVNFSLRAFSSKISLCERSYPEICNAKLKCALWQCKIVLYSIHFTNVVTLVWRIKYFNIKISMKVVVIFTRQFVTNHTTKITQVPIKAMEISIFLQIGMVKLYPQYLNKSTSF